MRLGNASQLFASLSARAGSGGASRRICLRHAAGSAIMEAGGLDVTQALLGHASITSTQIYLHPDRGVCAKRCSDWQRSVCRRWSSGRARDAQPGHPAGSCSSELEWLSALIDLPALELRGWDPGTRHFVPDPADPLFGYTHCPVRGCENVAYYPRRRSANAAGALWQMEGQARWRGP